ncbi:protein SPT2 homolog isoform X1 [Danaus plexippus]|uniref:protein SPT2 homolog isoform X1 n=2 Tax=Danaus plexippus TaxID=13037 RepID=UPI002AB0D28D|nr:protein SPT2 homolog isoform X1 [Danaus plexippus]
MEFRETLLAAQRNQQQKSSVGNTYYKARFDPPKKENKPRDKLSANIQKFLAKKEEEERQKQLEAQRKREELLAMRDPKALRKIQKTLKVIKSANKSVLADAIDREHTAVTLEGPEQPDQDDYGYESQEAAALYEKMMQKYSKLPEQPKFSSSGNNVNKDINGTRERVKHALRHEDDPVPHKRRRRTENGDRELSPPQRYEPEPKRDEKSDRPKIKKPAPPPMDFNQLLKLAEQKKSEPIELATKKVASEPEPERPMTKKQKREYEEEMARRQRKQMRLEAEKSGGRKVSHGTVVKEEKASERDRKPQPPGLGRIPKLSDKLSSTTRTEVKTHDKEREKDRRSSDRDRGREELVRRERERAREDALRKDKERCREDAIKKDKSKVDKEKIERDKLRLDKERLDKLKAERERIDREMERLNRDREKLEKTKAKLETKTVDRDRHLDRSKLGSKERDVKKSIDLKSQNTYRIDKNCNEKRPVQQRNSDNKMNGQSSQGKPVPKLGKEQNVNRYDIKDKALLKQRPVNGVPRTGEASRGLQRQADEKRPNVNGKVAPKMTNSFDFDKHVNSLGKNGTKYTVGDVKRKPNPNDIKKKQKRRMVDSDSEYDSEMDDFIDDGDENMDYSKHIKEIFGYDKSKYRDMDDDDDPMMESSFARQQREEYISKKIGIMEDLEDMRMEAMEKSKKKKSRRLSDDD